MARPIRLEFSGALYHVTSRGDGREAIYLSDDDRLDWLSVLGQVCKRFNWVVHAWCQMTNHYHLLIETPEGNLSASAKGSGLAFCCKRQDLPLTPPHASTTACDVPGGGVFTPPYAPTPQQEWDSP